MSKEKMLLSFGDEGLSFLWLSDEKLPEVNEGDIFILKFRDKELFQITIGLFEDITRPAMIKWLSRDLYPQRNTKIICEVYKK